jgi:putative endonuclease
MLLEVKTRIGTPFGTAAEAVTASKRAKIVTTAGHFMVNMQQIDLQPRFDIIEVVSEKNKGDATLWRMNHIPNAFGVDEH